MECFGRTARGGQGRRLSWAEARGDQPKFSMPPFSLSETRDKRTAHYRTTNSCGTLSSHRSRFDREQRLTRCQPLERQLVRQVRGTRRTEGVGASDADHRRRLVVFVAKRMARSTARRGFVRALIDAQKAGLLGPSEVAPAVGKTGTTTTARHVARTPMRTRVSSTPDIESGAWRSQAPRLCEYAALRLHSPLFVANRN